MPKLATPTDSVVAFHSEVALPEPVPGPAEERAQPEREEGERPEPGGIH